MPFVADVPACEVGGPSFPKLVTVASRHYTQRAFPPCKLQVTRRRAWSSEVKCLNSSGTLCDNGVVARSWQIRSGLQAFDRPSVCKASSLCWKRGSLVSRPMRNGYQTALLERNYCELFRDA